MIKKTDKNAVRKIRHERVRKKIAGTAERPRLCVYRSLNHIYTQVIDDVAGNTLVSASTMDASIKEKAAAMPKKEASALVGQLVAERAIQKGIKSVVFDRGGYIYTGRIAEVAEAARKAGLEF